jgi:hypothetical protein
MQRFKNRLHWLHQNTLAHPLAKRVAAKVVGWALLVFGVTIAQWDEYAAALGLFVASGVVLLLQAIHWGGIETNAKLSKVLRIIFILMTLAMLVAAYPVTNAKRGDKPWSDLTYKMNHLETLSAKDLAQKPPEPPQFAYSKQTPIQPRSGLKSESQWTRDSVTVEVEHAATIRNLLIELRVTCSLRDPARLPVDLIGYLQRPQVNYLENSMGKIFLESLDGIHYERTDEEGTAYAVQKFHLPEGSFLMGKPTSALSEYGHLTLAVSAISGKDFTRCRASELIIKLNGIEVERKSVDFNHELEDGKELTVEMGGLNIGPR